MSKNDCQQVKKDCQQIPFYPFKATVLLMLRNVTCSFPAESGEYTGTKKEFYIISFATVSTDDLQILRQILVKTTTFCVHSKQYFHLNI